MDSIDYDLVSVIKYLVKKKWSILIIVSLSGFLGLIIAFTAQVVYTSETTFVPKSNNVSGIGGGLNGLASLAGINLQNLNSEDLPITVYPKILKTTEFRRAILNTTIWSEQHGDSLTYKDYYENLDGEPGFLKKSWEFLVAIPSNIKSAIVPSTPLELNRSEDKSYEFEFVSEKENVHHQRINSQLKFKVNEIENYMTISFTMPDPVNAAILTKRARQNLEKKIIEIRTKSAKEYLKYVQDRFDENSMFFEQLSLEVADFKDSNRNLNTERANQKLRQLESQYDLAFEVYTELSRQVEQAELQVSKETPTFSVIEEAIIPLSRSAPGRVFILLLSIISGFILAMGYLLTPLLWKILLNQFK